MIVDYCIGTSKDVPELTEVLKNFYKESCQSFAEFDDAKMQKWLTDVVNNKDFGVFLAKEDNEIFGVLIGMLHRFPFTDTLVAGDYYWYVLPEKRGGMAAIRLMKWFEAWAKHMGAVRLMTAATSGIKTDRAQQLMQRLGFEPVGGSPMVKEI